MYPTGSQAQRDALDELAWEASVNAADIDDPVTVSNLITGRPRLLTGVM